MTSNLPYNGYTFFDAQSDPEKFNFYKAKVMDRDFDFFAERAELANEAFLFEVELSYPPEFLKFMGLDLAAFPRFFKTMPEHLSKSQLSEIGPSATKSMERNPSKLVSSCNDATLVEFIDNIALLCLWFSADIKNVTKCTRYIAYPYLAPYCNDLAAKRAATPSKIHQTSIKGLTNR